MYRPKVTSVTLVVILEEYSTGEHDFYKLTTTQVIVWQQS